MKKDDEFSPEIVFYGTIIQAEFLKSILEDSEIESYLKDEINGTLVPWVVTPGGIGSVKVVVAKHDYEKAMAIVEQYYENLKSEE